MALLRLSDSFLQDEMLMNLIEQIASLKTNESHVMMNIADYRHYRKRIKALAMIKRLRKY